MTSLPAFHFSNIAKVYYSAGYSPIHPQQWPVYLILNSHWSCWIVFKDGTSLTVEGGKIRYKGGVTEELVESFNEYSKLVEEFYETGKKNKALKKALKRFTQNPGVPEVDVSTLEVGDAIDYYVCNNSRCDLVERVERVGDHYLINGQYRCNNKGRVLENSIPDANIHKIYKQGSLCFSDCETFMLKKTVECFFINSQGSFKISELFKLPEANLYRVKTTVGEVYTYYSDGTAPEGSPYSSAVLFQFEPKGAYYG